MLFASSSSGYLNFTLDRVSDELVSLEWAFVANKSTEITPIFHYMPHYDYP